MYLSYLGIDAVKPTVNTLVGNGFEVKGTGKLFEESIYGGGQFWEKEGCIIPSPDLIQSTIDNDHGNICIGVIVIGQMNGFTIDPIFDCIFINFIHCTNKKT
jgi:hypothetical protein